MSEKKWVEIDYCPECRGIWLDKWELEKLMEKENQFQQSENNNFESQWGNNYSHKKKKKSSFFEEITDIFDF